MLLNLLLLLLSLLPPTLQFTPHLPLLPLPLSFPSPILLPTQTYNLKTVSSQSLNILKLSTSSPLQLSNKPTLVVLDRTSYGSNVDTTKGTIAALVDIKMTSDRWEMH